MLSLLTYGATLGVAENSSHRDKTVLSDDRLPAINQDQAKAKRDRGVIAALRRWVRSR